MVNYNKYDLSKITILQSWWVMFPSAPKVIYFFEFGPPPFPPPKVGYIMINKSLYSSSYPPLTI